MKITRVETIVLNLPMVIDGATPMLGGASRCPRGRVWASTRTPT